MTDNITVSRELLEQAIEALNEADNVLTSSMFSKAANALRATLEQPAPVQEPHPVAWEWRWFDANPNTVTFGQWSEWKRVEPRNTLCTVEDSLNEFKAYIANGQRYELRPLYTAQPRKAVKLGEHEGDRNENV